MGIDPQLWGPSGWRIIHFICYGAPANLRTEHKVHYATFLRAMGNVLPCGTCRMHFAENLEKHPLTEEVLATRDSLFAWSVEMHNEVNRMHGKREWTPEEAVRELLKKEEPQEQPQPTRTQTRARAPQWAWMVAMAVLLLLVLCAMYYFTR